jgi:prefoldin alpha subunit
MGNTDAEILVPLTTSLYVPGKLADRQKVIVDIGTGFYVEKVWDFPSSATNKTAMLERYAYYNTGVYGG